MILGSSGLLGVAIGNRSITCTELSIRGERRSVRRMAVLNLPAEVSLDQTAAAGQLLARFLRQHRFRASRAIVGVPARWLVATEREVPPAAPDQVRSILRLHAERLALSESGEMVFDYTGQPDPAQGGKVLLVGILRRRLDQIESLLDFAGIDVVAATSGSLALACGLPEGSDQPMLVLAAQDAELVWQCGGTPRLLRHVAVASLEGQGGPALGPLGSELRRAVTLAPANGSVPIHEVLLWDGVGLTERQVSELTTRLGVPVRGRPGLERLGVEDIAVEATGDVDPPERFAPSLALALAGAGRRLPLDFKHSRLALPRKRRFDRRAVWAAVLAAVGVLTVASLYWNVRQRQTELKQMQDQLKSMAGDVKSAEQMLDRVAFARGFFDARPAMLECLREITLAFRDDEPIWVTGFTLRENGKGQLIGKAASQKTILLLCGRLQNNPRFAEIRTLQMTEVNAAGGRSKEQSFTIGLTFVGTE